MPETFESLAVIALALLPGALYVWSFERLVGRWGISLADRALRFVGGSAIFHAAFLPVSFSLWATYVRSGEIDRFNRLPRVIWVPVLFYVAIPIAIGSLAGVGTRRGWRWTKLLTGPDPAPRAWDYLFSNHPDGWILLRLKTGTWLGGAYARQDGRRSYASGYPEAGELFIAEAASVDPETGEFEYANGEVVLLGSSILIRWEEVEYLEFIEA